MKSIAFTLKNQDGEERTLTDYLGQYVVLYFYPKDFTAGCSEQACQYQSYMEDFNREQVKLFGISKDSVKSHKEFKEKYHLEFELLSDHKLQLAKQLGIAMLGNLAAKRTTYILDPQHQIVEILKDVDPSEDAQQVLEIIKKHKEKNHND